ncbi:MAG TPA: peptidylprolyl isomerase, partial [Gemmatimonadaceae bacterium]|nr:peptidylprolyl isomerase [Gemmatimonadaceae bacterium]
MRRILQAEDRRDTTALAALASQAGTDERMLLLARRAAWRIRDPRFALRDSLPPLPSPPRYAEPAWRLRYRALRTVAGNCTSLATALADSAWPVRLRALDVLTPPCSDAGVLQTLRAWVDDVPADASRRERGAVSWHAAAHSILALARLRDDGARDRVVRLSTHAQPELRVYAARAAAILADTQLLRAFDHDPDDNVKEAAIDALSKLTGHASDSLYIGALSSSGAPAVRAAALALVGSPVPGLRARLDTTFERWVARGNASERDVRVALLQAAGRPASDDQPPSTMAPLPASAAALALGQPRQLVVVMSPASGGGSFTIRLRGDVAPIMASRVLQLAKSGYYDGGHWHRV